LGSASGASDESGTLVMRQDYDAFGNPHEALLPGLTGPRFTGKDWDEEAGLYYFNARWYDPELGRFITVNTDLDFPLFTDFNFPLFGADFSLEANGSDLHSVLHAI